jgi:hypothetical protein
LRPNTEGKALSEILTEAVALQLGKTLQHIDLGSNELTGGIPATLSLLTRVTRLSLNRNKRGGGIEAIGAVFVIFGRRIYVRGLPFYFYWIRSCCWD